MSIPKRITALLLAALFALAAGCAVNKDKAGAEYAVTDELLKSAGANNGPARVFYEIFVGSFADSDGDGTGDLRGIINKMDYLNDGDPDSGRSLGVEGLWLTPIFRSSSYHKYDIADYYDIDSAFGTMDDLKELIALCHERGMYLILDLPINHTSRMNSWFGSFVSAHRKDDTEDPYYNFYSWYDGSGSAPAGRHFVQISGTDHYYECNFSDDMPELDFDSPAVREAVYEVAKFYIDMGIDGFRFDAAKYVYFGDNKRSVEFWLEYMEKLRALKPDIYCVGEVWDGEGVIDQYTAAFDCFDFTVSQSGGLIAAAAQKGDANQYCSYVEGYLNKIGGIRRGALYTPFIANHDTDRAAGYLTVASNTIKMGANLYILGPGTPFIYYGEELGMRGSRGGSNTDANRRLAMPWGDDAAPNDPVGASYSDELRLDKTAADELKDPDSLYTYYKRLIMARRANPEIASGEYTALRLKDTKTGGFIATLEGRSVMVLHNPSSGSQTVDLSALTDKTVTGLRGVFGAEEASLEGNTLKLGGQTSVIIGLG